MKPTKPTYHAVAVRQAKAWLTSHGYSTVEVDVSVRPCEWKLMGVRSPTCSPAAWFGSAAVRRAICEIRSPRYSPADIIVAALRSSNPRIRPREPRYDTISRSQSRRYVLEAVAEIMHRLESGVPEVCVYGKGHVGPMQARQGWDIDITAGRTPDMETYSRECEQVYELLQCAGCTFKDVHIPPPGDVWMFTVTAAKKQKEEEYDGTRS